MVMVKIHAQKVVPLDMFVDRMMFRVCMKECQWRVSLILVRT